MAIIHALLALGSFAVVLTAGTVQAQCLPPEGPVSVTFTATPTSPLKPMPIGCGKDFIVVNQAMAASNDAGNPVLSNMDGWCQFTHPTQSSAKTVEVHGFCTYTDKEGDQIFEQCHFLPGAPNNCKIFGGTGKFESLQAALVITIDLSRAISMASVNVVGHKKGTYKIIKTN